MARYTITPWKHHADLLSVRQQLYSLNPDQDARRYAVDRIMAWKLRSNLPHAVESTALLVDAKLHHQNATAASVTNNDANSGLTISEFSIRAVYAAAFTRFVTGFCDIGRSRERGLEQSSMLAIAKQIDMPPDFVALRHETTHEELPGLKRLIGAVDAGLEWLWRVYWSRLEESKTGEQRQEEMAEWKGEVGSLLRAFRRGRRDDLKKGASGEGRVAETSQALLELCAGSRERAKVMAEMLVEEKLLLPTTRKLSDPMDGAFLIWDGLLETLSRTLRQFPRTLSEAIFGAITQATETGSREDTDRDAWISWTVHLVQQFDPAARPKLGMDIMQWCCLHPGYWAGILGQRLLDDGDEGLSVDSKDIFEASLISGKDVDPKLEAREGATQPVADDMEMDSEDAETRAVQRGWTKAARPCSLPIGVVR